MNDERHDLALQQRPEALERIFGRCDNVFHSPIPFYLDGDPCILPFRHHLNSATVYCTNEMTGGWGSGQKPGPLGEYEFVIVLPSDSPLGPVYKDDGVTFAKGWSGVLLTGYCKYSCQAALKHGETSGPLPPEFAPRRNLIFIELAGGRVPFEFGGARYGLLLMMSISDSEFEYRREHGADALIRELRKAKAFPLTDPTRPSAV